MNKKGGIVGGLIFLAIVIVILMIYNMYGLTTKEERKCLEQKAENYCESINQEYLKMYRMFGFINIFYCDGYVRTGVRKNYNFLDSELEECLG